MDGSAGVGLGISEVGKGMGLTQSSPRHWPWFWRLLRLDRGGRTRDAVPGRRLIGEFNGPF